MSGGGGVNHTISGCWSRFGFNILSTIPWGGWGNWVFGHLSATLVAIALCKTKKWVTLDPTNVGRFGSHEYGKYEN